MTHHSNKNAPSHQPTAASPSKRDDERHPFGKTLFSYTRTDALSDGVLVDVSDTAREAGFTLPVALTRALWEDVSMIPERVSEDSQGRLWELLDLTWFALSQVTTGGGDPSSVLIHEMSLSTGCEREPDEIVYRVKSVVEPVDAGGAVLMLMRPDEGWETQ